MIFKVFFHDTFFIGPQIVPNTFGFTLITTTQKETMAIGGAISGSENTPNNALHKLQWTAEDLLAEDWSTATQWTKLKQQFQMPRIAPLAIFVNGICN